MSSAHHSQTGPTVTSTTPQNALHIYSHQDSDRWADSSPTLDHSSTYVGRVQRERRPGDEAGQSAADLLGNRPTLAQDLATIEHIISHPVKRSKREQRLLNALDDCDSGCFACSDNGEDKARRRQAKKQAKAQKKAQIKSQEKKKKQGATATEQVKNTKRKQKAAGQAESRTLTPSHLASLMRRFFCCGTDESLDRDQSISNRPIAQESSSAGANSPPPGIWPFLDSPDSAFDAPFPAHPSSSSMRARDGSGMDSDDDGSLVQKPGTTRGIRCVAIASASK